MTLVEILKSLNLTHPVQLQGQALVISIDGQSHSVQCIGVTPGTTSSSRTILHLQPFFISGDETIGARVERLVWNPTSAEWLFRGICFEGKAPCISVQEQTYVETVAEYLRKASKFRNWLNEE